MSCGECRIIRPPTVRRGAARRQKFLGRELDAIGVGVVEQGAVVSLRNQSAGSAPRFLMLPPVRRRERKACHFGHLGGATELADDAGMRDPCRIISDIPN
jgi:hypothetical protein